MWITAFIIMKSKLCLTLTLMLCRYEWFEFHLSFILIKHNLKESLAWKLWSIASSSETTQTLWWNPNFQWTSPQLDEVGCDSSNNHIRSHTDESSVGKMWVASVIETRVNPCTRDARTGNVCKILLNMASAEVTRLPAMRNFRRFRGTPLGNFQLVPNHYTVFEIAIA